jgi:hypothetical protein
VSAAVAESVTVPESTGVLPESAGVLLPLSTAAPLSVVEAGFETVSSDEQPA